MSRKNLLLSLAFSLFALPACGTEPDLSEYEVGPEVPLRLQASGGIRLQGELGQNGTTIRYIAARGADTSSLRIEAADGLVLIDTVITGDRHTTTLLGMHTVTGAAGTTDGFDRDILAELAALPEAELIAALSDKLDDAGIDADLEISTEAPTGTINCPPVRQPAHLSWVFGLASMSDLTVR